MNITFLKIIALFCMLLDHISISLGSTGWMILPYQLETLFRFLGRIAFPIFAFSIVNSWLHTKDKKAYIERITLFSFLSQIPYTLAFYPGNLIDDRSQTERPFDGYFGLDYIIIYLVIISLFFLISHYYIEKSKKTLRLIALALIPALFTLKINYLWINGDNLNVFYTLSIGILFIFCYDKIRNRMIQAKILYLIMPFICVTLSLFIGIRADYGNFLLGIALIVLLYIFHSHKWQQSLCITIWGILLYGILLHNWTNAISVCLAALIILSYNKKKGSGIKGFFYYFYPIHLLAIGFINIILKHIL